jgi:hypothetical protein
MTARLLACLIVLACTAGCTAPRPAESPFTRDMAESTLHKIVDGVANGGVAGFCSRQVRSTATCATLLDDALRRCLLPGDIPEVTRAVLIPAKDHSEGGWLLELKGRTGDGQPYVSELLVVRSPDKPPQAAFGVYWTGLGIEESPFRPGNTKIPQSACPK